MSERLISADSHVRVTHEQIKANLAPRYHQAYDDAVAAFAERMAGGAGAANAAGAAMKAAEANSAFTRDGYWDPVERLKDMDTDGVEAEVLYSEVSAFRYLADMKEGMSESVRAFNDVLQAFAEPDPKRLIVSYQIPIHDIDLAVAEVKRVVGLNAKSLQLPVFPSEFGLPEYFDERYDPLFALIEETGLPICCHIGLNTNLDDLMRRDPTPNKGVMVPVTGLMTAEAFGMWIMGGVFEKFPRLKVVFVEPGLAWVAWWIHIVDDMATRQGYSFPAITELPSFYFRRNVFLTFIEERIALERLRDVIGVENMLWSTDFPHPVTSWPNSKKIIEEQLAGVPADERELILSGNAARVWNL
ncbi:MAG: putative metal-dependent hydrolase, TIM-barrel fold [Acidimicrobiales bacterium]|nr:putative metal-dependent hydrolase, TIM-barrel fold [Acidimicrobiales bacterium]